MVEHEKAGLKVKVTFWLEIGGALVYTALPPLYTAGAIFMSDPPRHFNSSFVTKHCALRWKSLKRITDRNWSFREVRMRFLLLTLDPVVFGLLSPVQLLPHSLLPAVDLNFEAGCI